MDHTVVIQQSRGRRFLVNSVPVYYTSYTFIMGRTSGIANGERERERGERE